MATLVSGLNDGWRRNNWTKRFRDDCNDRSVDTLGG